jgi:hypothetical protein
MPKNQSGYESSKLAAIKNKIAAKAKHLGIELKANSADSAYLFNNEKARPKAYINDPYKDTDNMIDEHVKYFADQLGMKDAHPDDVMKVLRAKWEGLQPDKQELIDDAEGSSKDPLVRNTKQGENEHVTVSFSADQIDAAVSKSVSSALANHRKETENKIVSLSAELETFKAERSSRIAAAEKAERDALVSMASTDGKVIPLSADEIATLPVATLKSMVSNLKKAEVPTSKMVPLSGDSGKVTDYLKANPTAGAKDRAISFLNSHIANIRNKSGVSFPVVVGAPTAGPV